MRCVQISRGLVHVYRWHGGVPVRRSRRTACDDHAVAVAVSSAGVSCGGLQVILWEEVGGFAGELNAVIHGSLSLSLFAGGWLAGWLYRR